MYTFTITNIWHLVLSFRNHPNIRRIQHHRSSDLPIGSVDIRDRLGAFYERVVRLWDSKVGKGFGRSSRSGNRKPDMDGDAMGGLCAVMFGLNEFDSTVAVL